MTMIRIRNLRPGLRYLLPALYFERNGPLRGFVIAFWRSCIVFQWGEG